MGAQSPQPAAPGANHAVADEHGEQHRRQGVEGDDDTLGEEGNRGGGAERAGEAATGQDDDIIGEEDDGAEQHMQQHDEGAGDMNGKENAEGRRGSGRKKRRRETRSLNRVAHKTWSAQALADVDALGWE